MSVPILRLRKDIWSYFPVNLVELGRGANKAERYAVEWHNMKVQQIATKEGKTQDQVKADMSAPLMTALRASKAWTVEPPAPGSRHIAVIAMRFSDAANGATRKNNVRKNNVGTRRVSRWNMPKPPTPPKGPKAVNKTAKAAKAPKAANKNTLKNMNGPTLVRKVGALLNKMGEENKDRLMTEIVAMKPRTEADFAEMVKKSIYDRVLDTQAYHPYLIELLGRLPTAAVTIVQQQLVARMATEPLYAHMEVKADEGELNLTADVEDEIVRQKRFFRGATLFFGYMYRQSMLKIDKLAPVLASMAALAADEDADYRLQDAALNGLLYILIRAGARLRDTHGDLLKTYMTHIRTWSSSWKRGQLRSLCSDFVEAAEADFMIKEGMPWTVGSPKDKIKVAKAAKGKAGKGAKGAVAAGLGPDIGELWRRFPLDVKQQGEMWVVKFHNKKLGERFVKEAGKYRTQKDLEEALAKQILDLIDHSAHWKRGPAMFGTLVTVVAK